MNKWLLSHTCNEEGLISATEWKNQGTEGANGYAVNNIVLTGSKESGKSNDGHGDLNAICYLSTQGSLTTINYDTNSGPDDDEIITEIRHVIYHQVKYILCTNIQNT